MFLICEGYTVTHRLERKPEQQATEGTGVRTALGDSGMGCKEFYHFDSVGMHQLLLHLALESHCSRVGFPRERVWLGHMPTLGQG